MAVLERRLQNARIKMRAVMRSVFLPRTDELPRLRTYEQACCEGKGREHCGECDSFPCELLHQFAYDPKQGDDGRRIEQCRAWSKENSAV